jgi:hypothetical protein
MSRPYDDWRLVLERRGSDEWIVRAATAGRYLHVYRVGDGDWIVSEVGRDSEGHGRHLSRALSAVASDDTRPNWCDAVPAALALELDEDSD